MTLEEFRAWFDGFTEEMSGPPTEKQWKRIKARVKEIDGNSPSYPVFIERYYRPWYRPHYEPHWTATNNSTRQMNMDAGTGRFAEVGKLEYKGNV